MLTILIVIAVLMPLGTLPTWPYSRGCGSGPGGSLGLLPFAPIGLLLADRL